MRRFGTPHVSEDDEVLLSQVESLSHLQAVVRWGFSLHPAWQVTEVIVQDEFCHDVIMTSGDALYLCFDTT